MAALTRTYLRGLVLPDPRIDYDAYSEPSSTLTQAGPQPGQAIATTDTSAVIIATGTQSAGGKLDVYAQTAGMPGLGGASILWRSDGDARYRGWEVPQIITGHSWAAFTTTLSYADPCILRLADDGLVIAFENTATAQVLLRRRAATATSWTSEVVYTHPGGVYASGARPCMVQLPSGRVLLFHTVEIGATVNVGMRYSDDSGDTWTAGQLFCLPTAISTATAAIRRMKVAYLAGQIVLFLDIRDTSTAYYRRLAQYASADLGSTFSLVAQLDGTSEANHAAFPDVAVVGDTLVLTYIRQETHATFGALVRPFARRLGSAFALFTSASEVRMQNASNPMGWGTYAGGDITSGDMAVCADDVGRAYAYGRDRTALGYDDIAVRYTDDAGASWAGPGSSSHQTTKAMLWRGEVATSNPQALSATFQRGRVALAHQSDCVLLGREPSVGVIFAGGWGAHSLPSLTGPITHDTMVAWERTWLPWDVPDALSTTWTYASAGAPTIALTANGMEVSGGLADSATWTATPTGTMAQGVIAEVWVAVTNGTATLEVRAGVAGPDSFRAAVRVTATTIVLRDEEGAVDLATINTAEGATGVWVRLAVGCGAVSGNNGRCAAYYAPGSRGDSEDREWVEIGTSTALVQGTDTTHRVLFRSATAGVAINQTWRFAGFTSDVYAGPGTNTTSAYSGNYQGDLLGRDLAAQSFYVADGLRLRGADGPAFRADAWDIDATYRYPVRAVFPDQEPSPRKTWRSTGTASDAVIAVRLTSVVADTSPALSLARVLYLGGINFRTATLEGLNAAGIWVTIASIDAATGQTGLAYTRYDTVVVASYDSVFPVSSGISRYLTADELYGARISFAGGTVVKRIERSTPGVWPGGPLATAAPTRLVLSSSSGVPASAKDAAVIMPNVAVVINDTTGTRYTGYRLRIPAQTTAEGYFEMGVMYLGYLHAFGQQYSANRSQDISPAYELTEGRGGTRRVQTTGPARRAVEIAWDEGVDASRLASTNDDYVEAHVGTGAIASPSDVVPSMLGLMSQLGGAATPVVYLPQVPVLSGGTTVAHIVAPPLMLYGRIRTETLRQDTIQGNEYETPGEVYRLARVRMEEEL
jgi:hypothetical protein